MLSLFVDTSGWGELVDNKSSFHRLAEKIYQQERKAQRQAITTNFVLTELVSLLATRLKIARTDLVRIMEDIKTSPFCRVVHVDPTLDDEAWQLLKSRQDKDWSLVDCSSFVLMAKLGITEALTTDHHFEQAGFVRLLK